MCFKTYYFTNIKELVEYTDILQGYSTCAGTIVITVTSQWARWRLKSPPSRVFIQPFIQAQIKKKSKLRVTDLCAGNSRHKWPVTRKMFPFDDVIMYCLRQSYCPSATAATLKNNPVTNFSPKETTMKLCLYFMGFKLRMLYSISILIWLFQTLCVYFDVYSKLNSLWPSNTIWRQGSRSTLAQVMACCLTAPSHYLNQCWLNISEHHLWGLSQEISQP